MAPKIGLSTKAFPHKGWWEEIHDFDMGVIEISLRGSRMYFDTNWIEKIKPYLEGLDLSLHSGSYQVFGGNNYFDEAQLAVLKAEIVMCGMLGTNELVFHLKDELMGNGEREIFEEEVLAFAKNQGVGLIYESNSAICEETVYRYLERYPGWGYNLDLGHLNKGLHDGGVGNLEDFLDRIRERVVYVHAHNNFGRKDQHLSLLEGNLDWKRVLNQLDLERVNKIVLEIGKYPEDYERTKQAIVESRDALAGYLAERV